MRNERLYRIGLFRKIRVLEPLYSPVISALLRVVEEALGADTESSALTSNSTPCVIALELWTTRNLFLFQTMLCSMRILLVHISVIGMPAFPL